MQVLGIKNSNLIHLKVSPVSNTSLSARSAEVSSTVLSAPLSSNNILLNSFLNDKRKAPTVEIGSPVAGFRVNEAFQFLKDHLAPELPVTENLQNQTNTSNLKRETLRNIKGSLERLALDVSSLRSPGSLNTHSASSSRPTLVEAIATPISPFGTFSITPERTATGNVLVSDKQDSNLGSLGLSGSFTINGFKTTIENSDTLIDIKNKINFGEDINRNGILDPAEDLNENSFSDILDVSPSEFGPGVFIIEDVNSNGTLDPAEDLNRNNRLDGGTNEIKVSASIQANRLVLTSLTEGTNTIDLKDDDSILLSLGFFQTNGKGLPILKEQQIDFSFNPPKDLNQIPTTAKIDLDGITVTNNTNTFYNAIKGTQLSIKQASALQAKVRIFADANKATKQIKSFFDSFNNAIRKINTALLSPPLFARDPDIQRIRNNLLDNSQRHIRRINEGIRAIDKVRANRENKQNIGLENVNNKKSIVQEITLTKIVQNIKDGVTSPFKSTGQNFLQRLSSIGILTKNDDTIKVNDTQLKRALTINPDIIIDLFNNPKIGLLPRLDHELSIILKTDLGDIDLKQIEIQVKLDVPPQLAEKFQRFVDKATFGDSVQNLIAVV